MREDTNPTEPVDSIEGGTNATTSENSITIDMGGRGGFYSNHLEDSHQEPTVRKEGEGIPTEDANASPADPNPQATRENATILAQLNELVANASGIMSDLLKLPR